VDDSIVTYLQNIKETFWPDWTDRCSKPLPPPTATPNKRGTFRKSKSEQQHAVSAATGQTATTENGVNGTSEKVTNGTENGESKDSDMQNGQKHENGDEKCELKKIDAEPVMPTIEIKVE